MKNLVSILLLSVCLFTSCSTLQQLEGVHEINDTGLYIKTEGQGEPIILMHGGPGLDHSYLKPHFDALLDEYRLIYFDQRGAGRSSAALDEESMTFDRMVADIDAIRKYLGYETVSVLGHSFGALPAMQFALDYPNSLNKLILVNSVGASMDYLEQYRHVLEARRTDEDLRERREILESEAMKENRPEAYKKLFYNTFKIQFYDRDKLSELNLWFPPNMGERQKLLRYLGPELENYNLYDRLSEIQQPVLLQHGDYDGNPVEVIKKMHDLLPDSELIIYENTGHFAFIEAREQLIRDIREFMR